MSDPYMTTFTPAPSTPNDRDDLLIQIENLTTDRDRVQSNFDATLRMNQELNQKISNVRGYIFDLYSMHGDVSDDVKEIAEYLGIELTKRIQGTATYTIEFTAEVPLDFDADDFEVSFSVECDSYEADNFDWTEVDTEVSAEDEV